MLQTKGLKRRIRHAAVCILRCFRWHFCLTHSELHHPRRQGAPGSGGTPLQRAGSGVSSTRSPHTTQLQSPSPCSHQITKDLCLISQWPQHRPSPLDPAPDVPSTPYPYSLTATPRSLWQREEQPPLTRGSPQVGRMLSVQVLTVNTHCSVSPTKITDLVGQGSRGQGQTN